MRNLWIAAFVGSVLVVPASVRAQRPGDTVIVTEQAQIRVGETVLRTVTRGCPLKVEDVKGDWLWVSNEATGWIHKSHTAKPNDVIAVFSEQIQQNPNDAGAYHSRGVARYFVGDIDPAIGDFNDAIRLDPKDESIYNVRGTAWLARREYDHAIDDFTAAIGLNPIYVTAYSNRGIAWRAKGEYDNAINDFTEAIRLDPKVAAAYNNRGIAWVQKDNFNNAISDYTEAIRLNPKYAVAYCNRGIALKGKLDYESAISDWTAAIRLDPAYAPAYRYRGRAFFTDRDFEKALADYTEAIRLDPNYPEPYDGIAWIYATCPDAQLRDATKSYQHAVKACQLTGWTDGARVGTLAAAYAEAGDFNAAVKWQTRAHELYSKKKQSDWGHLLELYKSGKPYRDEPKK